MNLCDRCEDRLEVEAAIRRKALKRYEEASVFSLDAWEALPPSPFDAILRVWAGHLEGLLRKQRVKRFHANVRKHKRGVKR